MEGSIEQIGNVRVDLAGGTLDIDPICYVIPNVVTINMAIDLKIKVKVERTDYCGIEIDSKDYHKHYSFDKTEVTSTNLYNGYFNEMSYVMNILYYFKKADHLKVTIESDFISGSGLGGSSTLGVTLIEALNKFTSSNLTSGEIISLAKSLEAQVLNAGPTGYQDYYPTFYKGIMALLPKHLKVDAIQLYSKELKEFIENHFILVNSNVSRNSGINNWNVFKAYFDGDEKIKKGLSEIAQLSFELYEAIIHKQYKKIPFLISDEGKIRKDIFPGFFGDEINEMDKKLSKQFLSEQKYIGLKPCGAGGGGHFLVAVNTGCKEEVTAFINKQGMEVKPFQIVEPAHE